MKILQALRQINQHGNMVMYSTTYFTLALVMWAFLGAYYTKQMGILVPLTILAGYRTLVDLSHLTVPYLKDLSLAKSGLAVLIVEILQTAVFGLIYINMDWFIYGLMILKIFDVMSTSIFGINYDVEISKLDFKEIQIMERVNFSLYSIIAGFLAIWLYYFDIEAVLYTAFIIQVVATMYCFKSYSSYWSKIK